MNQVQFFTMKKTIVLITAISVLISCKTMNKQQKGTAIGAGGGAAIGAIVTKGSVWGILIGAAVGGVAGNLIGKKMDQQAKELKQAVPTASVERVGEGINMTFDASLVFEINSDKISEQAKKDLAKAAGVFKDYETTNILIEGHTDDTGPDDFNMELSKKRAASVASFLEAQGVAKTRLIEKWYGETQPKYANDNEENRKKNRRVELAIYADEKMKEDAKDGKLK
jgi:outer membrane protein OmpA-like peptidoglycan-associated protein